MDLHHPELSAFSSQQFDAETPWSAAAEGTGDEHRSVGELIPDARCLLHRGRVRVRLPRRTCRSSQASGSAGGRGPSASCSWCTSGSSSAPPRPASGSHEAEIGGDVGRVRRLLPWSWWPLLLGLGCALFVTALAIGWWIVGLAVPRGAARSARPRVRGAQPWRSRPLTSRV
ncbi:cytochrome c oxidase subunit 4 [Kocuria rhizophila]|nr:cytochrome c oxidase subunit 4 [Kocuria rhizophila]